MKKIISALQGTALIMFISCSHATGQDIASGANQFGHNNMLQGSGSATTTSVSAVAASVSKKAIRNFMHTYKGNVQPEWSLMKNGGYTASFTEADMQICVYYDKAGNWVSNIKRYGESKMSPELRQLIKPVYYDYKINGISEITVPGNIVQLLYLAENATSFKTVRVCNGEMEVIEWIKNNKIMDL